MAVINYYYSDGDVTISGVDGNDELYFIDDPNTIDSTSVFDHKDFSFLKDGNDFVIYANNGGTITIENHFLNNTDRIETIYANSMLSSFQYDRVLDMTGAVSDITVATSITLPTLIGTSNFDYIFGSNGNDTIYGKGMGLSSSLQQQYFGELLFGGNGNDTIYVIDPSTTSMPYQYQAQVYGGNGVDHIYGSDSSDYIDGGAGDDIIKAYSGNDKIEGMEGTDTIFGGDGTDHIYGDSQYQSLNLTDPWIIGDDDVLWGGSGGDYIWGGHGNDILHGEEGDDRLSGDDSYSGYGNDTIYGGAGNDSMFLYGATDKGYGGDDNDIFRIQNGVNHEAYGDDGDDTFSFYDSLQVNQFVDNASMYGGHGDDTFLAHGYQDNNGIYGYSSGAQYMDGGQGDDKYEILFYDAYRDATYTINDRLGVDSIYLRNYPNASQWPGQNVAVTRQGWDAVITYTETNDDDPYTIKVTIEDYLRGGYIENIYYGGALLNFDPRPLLDMSNVYSGLNAINGTAQSETISGTVNDDLIYAYGGDDTVIASSGSDTILGGEGNDVINGGSGSDYINGEDGIDTADYSDGLAVSVDLANNVVSGGHAEGDTLISIENIKGSDNSGERDYIWGDAQDNVIEGQAGDDILEGGAGADTLDGGTGWDYARYIRSDAAVTINFETGVNTGGHAQGDVLISIEAIVGSDYSDTITGAATNDYFKGEGGDDMLSGGLGWDKLYGGEGDDTYVYTGGSDNFYEQGTGTDRVEFDAVWSPDDLTIDGNVFTFDSNNKITFDDISRYETFAFDGFADMTLSQLEAYIASLGVQVTGTAGDDTFTGVSGIEHFDGLGGTDTVDYSASTVGNTVDLDAGTGSTGDAAGDTYISIENIIGSDTSSERDWIWGDAQDNAIYGMAGDDILEGGAGADTIDGGAGWDYSRYTLSDAAVNINLETGVNTGGHADGDTLTNIEAIVGSAYGDTIRGGNSNDYLKGEGGDDTIAGGSGIDQLYGGSGADTFLFDAISAFNNVDQLRDFNLGQNDKIDISDLLVGYDELTDAITDFVQITDNGTDSTLSIDADGGANNFVSIATLYGVTGLTDEEALETSGNLITV